MIYLQQLKKKLIKPWNSGAVLLDCYNEISAYPRRIPLQPPAKEDIDKTPNMLELFKKDLSALDLFCKENNLIIEYKTKNLYTYGRQNLPVAVIIPTADSHANALGCYYEFYTFREILFLVEDCLPQALDYFIRCWKWTKNNPEDAKKLIASVEWRLKNPHLVIIVHKTQPRLVDLVKVQA